MADSLLPVIRAPAQPPGVTPGVCRLCLCLCMWHSSPGLPELPGILVAASSRGEHSDLAQIAPTGHSQLMAEISADCSAVVLHQWMLG